LRTRCKIGAYINEGDVVGVISDPFGEREAEVRATSAGLVIGRANLPVVNQGDALFHVATLPERVMSEPHLERLEDEIEADLLFDEDEIL